MAASTPFGRYLLHGILGSGGMAVVYRASVDGPHGFRRDLVVKRMLPGFFTDPRNVRMMAAEARVLARLTHPCVVQLYEFGEVSGEYFLAMEYVDGADLSTILGRARERGSGLELESVCFLGTQLASALAAVHELTDERGAALGVVHRDVTPSNVMVSVRGEVKLLDFGIALMAAAPGVEVDKTKTNFVKGKLTYVAPEQLAGARPDSRSDLYSLGVVLYECFTGQRLFAGANDLEVLARRQALLEVPRLSVAGVGVPPEVDELVATLLTADPEKRTVKARDAERVLARFSGVNTADRLAVLVSEARRQTVTPALPTDEIEAEPIDLPFTQPGVAEVPRRAEVGPRRRWPYVGGVVAALSLAALVAFGLARQPVPTVEAAEVPPRTEPAANAPPVEPPTPPPPVEPAKVAPSPARPNAVRLTVRGTNGAQVELDGHVVGTIPLSIEVDGGRQARLEISRTGFGSVERVVELSRDVELEVKLKRRAPAVKQPEAKAPPEKKEFADPFR